MCCQRLMSVYVFGHGIGHVPCDCLTLSQVRRKGSLNTGKGAGARREQGLLGLSQRFKNMGQKLVTFIDEDPRKVIADAFASLLCEYNDHLPVNPLFKRLAIHTA